MVQQSQQTLQSQQTIQPQQQQQQQQQQINVHVNSQQQQITQQQQTHITDSNVHANGNINPNNNTNTHTNTNPNNNNNNNNDNTSNNTDTTVITNINKDIDMDNKDKSEESDNDMNNYINLTNKFEQINQNGIQFNEDSQLTYHKQTHLKSIENHNYQKQKITPVQVSYFKEYNEILNEAHSKNNQTSINYDDIKTRNETEKRELFNLVTQNQNLLWSDKNTMNDVLYNFSENSRINFMSNKKVWDKATGKQINYENSLTFPIQNMVIKTAINAPTNLYDNPCIAITGISEDLENQKNYFHWKFDHLCTYLGGAWLDFQEDDILHFQVRKPNDLFEKNALQNRMKWDDGIKTHPSNYDNYNINNNNNNFNFNFNNESKINDNNNNNNVFNYNDNISYTFTNEQYGQYSDKQNENKEYSVKNGMANFYEIPINSYHILIFINKDGPWMQRHGSSMINSLNTQKLINNNNNEFKMANHNISQINVKIDNNVRNNENDMLHNNISENVHPLWWFNKQSQNKNLLIKVKSNMDLAEIQFDLPKTYYTDMGNQVDLKNIVFNMFKLFNEKEIMIHKDASKRAKPFPINKIQHVFRHKTRLNDKEYKGNNNNNRNIDNEREKWRQFNRKYKDRVSVIFANHNIDDIPVCINLKGKMIKIIKKEKSKDIYMDMLNELQQCQVCLGPSCQAGRCPYYSTIIEERRDYRTKNGLASNMKLMGKGCTNCGEFAGHWFVVIVVVILIIVKKH